MTLTDKQKRTLVRCIKSVLAYAQIQYKVKGEIPRVFITQYNKFDGKYIGGKIAGCFTRWNPPLKPEPTIHINPRCLRSYRIRAATNTIAHEIAHWVQWSKKGETLCEGATEKERSVIIGDKQALIDEHTRLTEELLIHIMDDCILWGNIKRILLEGDDYKPLWQHRYVPLNIRKNSGKRFMGANRRTIVSVGHNSRNTNTYTA